MTDTDRLRKVANWSECCSLAKSSAALLEAADEIDRLKKEYEKGNPQAWARLHAKQRDEIKRLLSVIRHAVASLSARGGHDDIDLRGAYQILAAEVCDNSAENKEGE